MNREKFDSKQSALTDLIEKWFTDEGIADRNERLEIGINITFVKYPPVSVKVAISESMENGILDALLASPVTDIIPDIDSYYGKRFECVLREGARDIITLGQLVRHSTREMLKYRNFGIKTLTALEVALAKKGLHFGTAGPIRPIEAAKLKSSEVQGTARQ